MTYEWIGYDLYTGRTFDRTDNARNEECLRIMLRAIYGNGLLITTIREFL